MDSFAVELARIHALVAQREATLSQLPTTSSPAQIQKSLSELPTTLPRTGIGLTATTGLLLNSVAPAMSNHHSRFFGLVTGGVTAPALLADQLVSSFDSCVQVHLPNETISTILETITLHLILSLLSLPSSRFTGNALTTGATGSNIQALTIGREYTINAVLHRSGKLTTRERWSVAEHGLAGGMGVEVEVLCAVPHASIAKAASIVGIGRSNVVDLRSAIDIGCFDLETLEGRLRSNYGRKGSVVVVSFGEVNTGAIECRLEELRSLCDEFDAWLHIDAAFGAFAILHPSFSHLSSDLALGDSITADAHKWLNTPYAAGIIFSRSLELVLDVLGPGSDIPAYLTPATSFTVGVEGSSATIGAEEEGREKEVGMEDLQFHQSTPAPLFTVLENSRRFIALPIYASLICLGREGYGEIVRRNIGFTRRVERWMRGGGAEGAYEVLTPFNDHSSSPFDPTTTTTTTTTERTSTKFQTLNILLFAPSPTSPPPFSHPSTGSKSLLLALNKTKEVYFTPTVWKGRGAIRMAVSNWATGITGGAGDGEGKGEGEGGRDWDILREVFERVVREAREVESNKCH